MDIRVNVFANLKDHYESVFTLEVPNGANVEHILDELALKRPESLQILQSCRIAVGEDLVDKHYSLQENEEVFLLPPSSGG